MTNPSNDKQFAKPHTHSREGGYEEVEYKHQNYPKVVGRDEETGQEIIVQNEDEHKQFVAAQKAVAGKGGSEK